MRETKFRFWALGLLGPPLLFLVNVLEFFGGLVFRAGVMFSELKDPSDGL